MPRPFLNRRAINAPHRHGRPGRRLSAERLESRTMLDASTPFAFDVGSTGDDVAFAVARNVTDNSLYVTGSFQGTVDFDPTHTHAQAVKTSRGGSDIFVARYDASGNFLWVTQLGGTNNEQGTYIAVMNDGTSFITGTFFGTAVFGPDMTSPARLSSNGGSDIFITRLNSGGSLVWAGRLGGPNDDWGSGLVVGSDSRLYTTGAFRSTVDFNPDRVNLSGALPKPGGIQTVTSAGAEDIFVSALNLDGTFAWKYRAGGSGSDRGYGIAMGSDLSLYVDGSFQNSVTFGGVDTLASAGGFDIFVTRLASSGAYQWTKRFGGTEDDIARAISVGSEGTATLYLTGQFRQTVDFRPGTAGFALTSAGAEDLFALKLNYTGVAQWATRIGTAASDRGQDITVTSDNRVFLTGLYNGTIDTSDPTNPDLLATAGRAVVARLNSGNGSVTWQKLTAGNTEEEGHGISAGPTGTEIANVAGYFAGTATFGSGVPTPPSWTFTSQGARDVFLWRTLGSATPAGVSNPGLYTPADSTFYLKRSQGPGAADNMFQYGVGGQGWLPIVGDWDGIGGQTAGLYDPASSNFYLKNTLASGPADVVFNFGVGGHGWLPLAGDWNGDGIDTIGLYDPSQAVFYIKNTLTGGPADTSFMFGIVSPAWRPIAGDWDGDTRDTVGVYARDTSTFYLKNTLAGGDADVVVNFGVPNVNWVPLGGDWNGDGVSTIGLYKPDDSLFFLKNQLTPGDADISFMFGTPAMNAIPIVGNWQAAALLAAAGPASTPTANALDPALLQSFVLVAADRWAAAGREGMLEAVRQADFAVADLPGAELGRVEGGHVILDSTAAGWGWYLDPTPRSDEEFGPADTAGSMRALDPRAVDQVDLFTVLEHELGHLWGDADAQEGAGIMDATLPLSTRRLPG